MNKTKTTQNEKAAIKRENEIAQNWANYFAATKHKREEPALEPPQAQAQNKYSKMGVKRRDAELEKLLATRTLGDALRLKSELERVTAQRDELLAALKRVEAKCRHAGAEPRQRWLAHIADEAQAAIAAAGEGGK